MVDLLCGQGSLEAMKPAQVANFDDFEMSLEDLAKLRGSLIEK